MLKLGYFLGIKKVFTYVSKHKTVMLNAGSVKVDNFSGELIQRYDTSFLRYFSDATVIIHFFSSTSESF